MNWFRCSGGVPGKVLYLGAYGDGATIDIKSLYPFKYAKLTSANFIVENYQSYGGHGGDGGEHAHYSAGWMNHNVRCSSSYNAANGQLKVNSSVSAGFDIYFNEGGSAGVGGSAACYMKVYIVLD